MKEYPFSLAPQDLTIPSSFPSKFMEWPALSFGWENVHAKPDFSRYGEIYLYARRLEGVAAKGPAKPAVK